MVPLLVPLTKVQKEYNRREKGKTGAWLWLWADKKLKPAAICC